MSALPPKADIDGARWNVCFGPISDIPEHRRSDVTPEAAETAALLGFGLVRRWPNCTALALGCGDAQSPHQYSELVQNRLHFLQADDTNDRWGSLRRAE
jgi:hypothetical protein